MGRTERSGGGGGFTLIELLVVVAVIAVLISVLLPAMQAARGAAQRVVGANLQRQMAIGQRAFASDNDNAYAGPNTTGLAYGHWTFEPSFSITVKSGEGTTSATTPVNPLDWMSPSIGSSMGFSPNRAERYADILNRMACPSAGRMNDAVYGLGDVNDDEDFFRVLESEGFNQISFLSPRGFHWVASGVEIPVPGGFRGGRPVMSSYTGGMSGIVDVPSSFRPRYDKVGRASGKVIVTDGCQFLTDDNVLDFDVDHKARHGAFIARGPIDAGCFAFSRGEGALTSRVGWKLSVRHNGNTRLNTARFDGSVRSVSLEEAYSDPRLWYPSGSRWNGDASATAESLEFMSGEDVVY